jgi:hypothetical protein
MMHQSCAKREVKPSYLVHLDTVPCDRAVLRERFYGAMGSIPDDLRGLVSPRFHSVACDEVKENRFAFKHPIFEPDFAMLRYGSRELSTFCDEK